MAIFISYTQKRRTVKVLTAGEPQFLLCPASDIVLTAELSDITNLENHTLLWVQTKGPAVILSATDELSVSFPFADSEDKTFRFYLDFGTNREQYKEVQIFYTPTSLMNPRAISTQQTTWATTLPNLEEFNDFVIPATTYEIEGNVDVLPATRYEFSLTGSPGLIGLQKGMEVYTSDVYTTNPTTLYASYGESDFPTSLTLQRGVYKVRVFYLVDGREIVIDSPLLVAKGINLNGICVVHDTIRPLGKVSKSENILRFSIQNEVVQDTLRAFTIASRSKVSNIVSRFTNIRAHPDDYPSLADSFTMSKHPAYSSNVSRLDPGNIGN